MALEKRILCLFEYSVIWYHHHDMPLSLFHFSFSLSLSESQYVFDTCMQLLWKIIDLARKKEEKLTLKQSN